MVNKEIFHTQEKKLFDRLIGQLKQIWEDKLVVYSFTISFTIASISSALGLLK
jgi:hypothetical protein